MVEQTREEEHQKKHRVFPTGENIGIVIPTSRFQVAIATSALAERDRDSNPSRRASRFRVHSGDVANTISGPKGFAAGSTRPSSWPKKPMNRPGFAGGSIS